tara:strand:+ start:1366 stop:1641 length:276 start_codon:yes stop_codon:yes gene_type:complete
MALNYGFIITKDHIEDGKMDGETITVAPALLWDLEAGKGEKFKMYDDDNTLYYEGRMIHQKGEEMFFPLDSVGENAGCTWIGYESDGFKSL